ncbi:MAG: hypothetical protein ABI947_18410 [Chloroflexota bacterium]
MAQLVHSEEVLPDLPAIKVLKHIPILKAFLIIFLCMVEETMIGMGLQLRLRPFLVNSPSITPLLWGLFFARLVIVPLVCRWSDRWGSRRFLITCQIFVFIVLLVQFLPMTAQVELGTWILSNIMLVVLLLMIPVMFDVALSTASIESQIGLIGKLIALYVTLGGAVEFSFGWLLASFGFKLSIFAIALICPVFILFLLFRWHDIPKPELQLSWHWKPIISALFFLLFIQIVSDRLGIIFQAIRVSQIGEWTSIEGIFAGLVAFVVQFFAIGWLAHRFFCTTSDRDRAGTNYCWTYHPYFGSRAGVAQL